MITQILHGSLPSFKQLVYYLLDGLCTSEFGEGQSVVVSTLMDGDVHSATCDDCVDGIVHRGDLTKFEVAGDTFFWWLFAAEGQVLAEGRD
jgi:hypothetical protein